MLPIAPLMIEHRLIERMIKLMDVEVGRIKQNLFFSFLVAVFLAEIFVAAPAFCDSCPYCGQEYGEAMPGDEARVMELRRQHEEECGRSHESSSTGGGETGGGWQQVQTGPSQEEIEKKQRWNALLEANNQANIYLGKGDYENAVAYYKKALEYVPDEPTVKKNLENAEELLARMQKEKAETAARQQTITSAVKNSVDRIRKDILPRAGSVDFDGRGTGQEKPGGGLDFMPYPAESQPAVVVDSSVVDLRDAKTLVVDPLKVQGSISAPVDAADSKATGQPQPGLERRNIIVPSPTGALTPEERHERQEHLSKISDTDLTAKIEQTKRVLEKMRGDFINDSKLLQEWVAEAQDAEEKALRESFKAIAGAAVKYRNFDAGTLKTINSICEKGLKVLDYAEPVQGIIKNPGDHQSNLELGQLYFKELHDVLKKYQGAYSDSALISEHAEGVMKGADVTDVTGFAGFLVNYSYEASRWAVAHDQINTIINNLDNPRGKLTAQESMKLYYEDLIQERNRRSSETAQ